MTARDAGGGLARGITEREQKWREEFMDSLDSAASDYKDAAMAYGHAAAKVNVAADRFNALLDKLRDTFGKYVERVPEKPPTRPTRKPR